jgi:tRNA A37 N6-isopentenylltransferase MiaA
MYDVTDASQFQCSALSVQTLNLVHSQWPQIIEDILDRGGLPVIVGGTNFYIQVH